MPANTVRCLRCDVPLVYSATRRLADKAIFAFEWTVVVLECPSCGHIEMFNPDRAQFEKPEQKDAGSGQDDSSKIVMFPGGEDLPPETPDY